MTNIFNKEKKALGLINDIRDKIKRNTLTYLNESKYRTNSKNKINLAYLIECEIFKTKKVLKVLRTDDINIKITIDEIYNSLDNEGKIETYTSLDVHDCLVKILYDLLGEVNLKEFTKLNEKYNSVYEINDMINAVESGDMPESYLDSIPVDLMENVIKDIYSYLIKNSLIF